MSHTFDDKAFGPGSSKGGPFHVVHQQSETTIAAFPEQQHADEDAEKRTSKAKGMGSQAVYETRPASEGKGVR